MSIRTLVLVRDVSAGFGELTTPYVFDSMSEALDFEEKLYEQFGCDADVEISELPEPDSVDSAWIDIKRRFKLQEAV